MLCKQTKVNLLLIRYILSRSLFCVPLWTTDFRDLPPSGID